MKPKKCDVYMKKKLLSILLPLFLLLSCSLAGQIRVSILGDSYSTFYGHVRPSTNLSWYGVPDEPKENDVRNVEQTWWSILTRGDAYRLEVNNSYSGSTICCTGYDGADYSDRAFIARTLNLGDPEVIIIFGGTNDSWAKAPVGDDRFSGWDKRSLYSFRPAFSFLLHSLTRLYPSARLYNVTNTELSPEITTAMDEICHHYGVTNIRLHDIDKQWGHPSVAGMESIARQILSALRAGE